MGVGSYQPLVEGKGQCRQLKPKNPQRNKPISVVVVLTPEGVKYE
jgi:hypothetical protein